MTALSVQRPISHVARGVVTLNPRFTVLSASSIARRTVIGLPPEMKALLEVLLERRNEKVIADLKAQLPKTGRHSSIAIFFGTGHMPDMEKRLRAELKYQPAGERWFTAFDVDLVKSGITPSEREFVDSFVRWQLAEARARGSSKTGSNETKPATPVRPAQ